MTIGQYIRKLRNERGLTLTQLGAMIGLDSGALSKIENGKKELDQKCLPKLAETFALNLNELKDEFISERIAYEIFKNSCSDLVLKLAEEKIKYLKSSKIRQEEIKF